PNFLRPKGFRECFARCAQPSFRSIHCNLLRLIDLTQKSENALRAWLAHETNEKHFSRPHRGRNCGTHHEVLVKLAPLHILSITSNLKFPILDDALHQASVPRPFLWR